MTHPLDRAHRAYIATKAAAIAIFHIVIGLGLIGLAAIPAALWYAYLRVGEDLTSSSNVFAWICFAIALPLGIWGLCCVFEALPGITPRRVQPRSRSIASRRSQRSAPPSHHLKGTPMIGMRDKGPYLGLTLDKHADPVHYPGPLHLMLWGPNGSGKDMRIITQHLAQLRRSICVVDPKAEQAAITARHRAKFSKVIIINPFELLTDTHPWLKSHGFNPLARADFDPSNKDFNDKATSLGDFLIKIDGPEAFFATGGKALIDRAHHVGTHEKPASSEPRNVRRMLTAPYGVEDGKPAGLFRNPGRDERKRLRADHEQDQSLSQSE